MMDPHEIRPRYPYGMAIIEYSFEHDMGFLGMHWYIAHMEGGI
jgi:hypothetical protein